MKNKILLLEDDEDVRIVLKPLFQNAGFDFVDFSDPYEALKYLELNQVDLIMSDISLNSDIDGYEFKNKLKDKDCCFVFITAKDRFEDQIKGFDLEIDDYIIKPFDPIILLAKMRSILNRRRNYHRSLQRCPMTLLLNKTEFHKDLLLSIGKHSYGAMMFIDLDNFKKVNDEFGHLYGDEVLISFSELLKTHCRAVDVVGRYGGEEFVVFLPETDASGALNFGNRILKEFNKINHSFSAGVSMYPYDTNDIEDLYRKADQAMYEAKNNGKNQIRIYSK